MIHNFQCIKFRKSSKVKSILSPMKSPCILLFVYSILNYRITTVDGSFCTLSTIIPSLGPSSGGTNVTIRTRGTIPDSPTYVFGLQEIQPSSSLAYTTPQQDEQDDFILTRLTGCNGSLPFQYYPSLQKLISSSSA